MVATNVFYSPEDWLAWLFLIRFKIAEFLMGLWEELFDKARSFFGESSETEHVKVTIL
jgi:hypothetical protein